MIKFKEIRRGAYEMSTGVLSTQVKNEHGPQKIIVSNRTVVLLARKQWHTGGGG
jgi:hypothetical protein